MTDKPMKVLGIIAEYNPFHNGHLYHLSQSKERIGADFVVVVMSGNFVQRGEPALVNKWDRSKMAVENGIDLVIELPVAYACNNSEIFARGAIQILNGLGCVTHLSFGSEEANLDGLQAIARVLAEEGGLFKESLRKNLDMGLSFAKSREMGIGAALHKDVSAVLKGSNNILAIEYLKQLLLTNSTIVPVMVTRKGPAYKEVCSSGGIASATQLRNLCEQQLEIREFVPPPTWDFMEKQEGLIFWKNLHLIILSRLLQLSKEELSQIYSVSEGLENRIKGQVRHAASLDELVGRVVSKRYTETRIKRVLIHSLLGIRKSEFHSMLNRNLNYCRVLGFNEKGASLLRKIKRDALNSIPVLTNINKELESGDDLWHLLELDVLASDLYNLLSNKNIHDNSDYVVKPFYKF